MRWEYLTLKFEPIQDRYLEMMNSLGRGGWELVAVNDGIAYFKRPIMSIYDEVK